MTLTCIHPGWAGKPDWFGCGILPLTFGLRWFSLGRVAVGECTQPPWRGTGTIVRWQSSLAGSSDSSRKLYSTLNDVQTKPGPRPNSHGFLVILKSIFMVKLTAVS